MPTEDNVVNLSTFKRDSQQEDIDDIGAKAFIFLRDCAEEMGLPVKDVITEHILGLSKIVAAVEGHDEAQSTLKKISEQIGSTRSTSNSY